MKIVLFCLTAFLLNTINGQRQPPGTCIEGTIENGNDVGEVQQVACDFGEDQVCMTKIERQGSFVKSVRECTQTQACENNASGNNVKCMPGQNGVQICFFCCDFDLCNQNVEEIQNNLFGISSGVGPDAEMEDS